MTRKQRPRHRGEQLLTRFLDFAYEKKEVKPSHIALYAHIVTTYNKLGWPDTFALPTDMAMMRSHVSNRKTYYRLLDDLVRWGWVKDCGRNGRECRRLELLEGPESQSYGRALSGECGTSADDESACGKDGNPRQEDGMKRFDHLFGCWSRNVRENDKRWVDSVTKETGIKDYDLAMSLYKEHIIRNSKIDAWMDMSLGEKKFYFVNSSRYFVTDACKAVKEVVAKVITIGGKHYVEQYGMRMPLPEGHKPQPDVNYYWDEMWNNWRRG